MEMRDGSADRIDHSMIPEGDFPKIWSGRLLMPGRNSKNSLWSKLMVAPPSRRARRPGTCPGALLMALLVRFAAIFGLHMSTSDTVKFTCLGFLC